MATLKTQMIWSGAKSRPLGVCRPCECGCDQRDGYKGVGYLTGSDAKGRGFTVWIQDEKVFTRLARALEAHGRIGRRRA